MYALCVSGAVSTQGFVCKFLCDIYTFSFSHTHESSYAFPRIAHVSPTLPQKRFEHWSHC